LNTEPLIGGMFIVDGNVYRGVMDCWDVSKCCFFECILGWSRCNHAVMDDCVEGDATSSSYEICVRA
jgi:hypothetical protein